MTPGRLRYTLAFTEKSGHLNSPFFTNIRRWDAHSVVRSTTKCSVCGTAPPFMRFR